MLFVKSISKGPVAVFGIYDLWLILCYFTCMIFAFLSRLISVRCGLNMQEICVHSDVNVYVYDCISSVNIHTCIFVYAHTHKLYKCTETHAINPKNPVVLSTIFNLFIYLP